MPQTAECRISGKQFEITDRDLEFYAKIGVPPPRLSPYERRRRRFAFRNERALYKRKSSLSGAAIISAIHEDEPMPVYSSEEWFGDTWDATDYGRPYDFSRSFMEQFAELQNKVPTMSNNSVNNQNCPYINYAASCKDCHLIFGSVYCEDCMYGNPYYCKKCVDSLLVRDSEFCYECITCEKCYECFYCQDCANSNSLLFCYDCHGSSNCIGSVGLRNKEYYIFNRKYSKEEFTKMRAGINLCDPAQVAELKKRFEELKLAYPRRFAMMLNTENCTGDYVYQSKNTFDCFDVQRCEDCSYCAQVIDMKDCYDCNYMEECELCCEYICNYQNQRVFFTVWCNQCSDVWYSSYCASSNYLFGCIGIKHKSYCILNKQYTKEEYEELVPRIIEQMSGKPASAKRGHGPSAQASGFPEAGAYKLKRAGERGSGFASPSDAELKNKEFGEFFHPALSMFCYNETVAQEYFPLTREEALARGYRWREKNPRDYREQTYRVPAEIAAVPSEITNEILACVTCAKNFRIEKMELGFYKLYKLPIPAKCPDCRHKSRLALRNPRLLFDRRCHKCGADFKTAYTETRLEKIYCEKCYLGIIY